MRILCWVNDHSFCCGFHVGTFTFVPSFIRKNKKILFIFYMERGGGGSCTTFSLASATFCKAFNSKKAHFFAHASAPWAGAFHMLSWYHSIHLIRRNFSFRENTFLCTQDLHLFVSACVLYNFYHTVSCIFEYKNKNLKLTAGTPAAGDDEAKKLHMLKGHLIVMVNYMMQYLLQHRFSLVVNFVSIIFVFLRENVDPGVFPYSVFAPWHMHTEQWVHESSVFRRLYVQLCLECLPQYLVFAFIWLMERDNWLIAVIYWSICLQMDSSQTC